MAALTDRQCAILRVISRHSGVFEWGVRDCVTLALDVVEAIRGVRPVAVNWQSEEDAAREIERRGGLANAVSEVLGAPYDPTQQTPADGDIVLVRMRDVEMLGVWAMSSPIGPASQGLHRVDPKRAALAWRV